MNSFQNPSSQSTVLHAMLQRSTASPSLLSPKDQQCIEIAHGWYARAMSPISLSEFMHLSALKWAAQEENEEMLRWLCERLRVDVDAKNSFGWTALTVAAYKGNLSIARYLVEKRLADPNTRDENGTTPLMYAAREGHLSIVRYLCEEIAVDINICSHRGWTALMHAVAQSRKDIVFYFINSLRANVVAPEHSEWSELMVAVQGGDFELVRYLCEHAGARTNIYQKGGSSLLAIVRLRGLLRMENYLKHCCT